LKKDSILIVDPENSHRDHLAKVLRAQGFKVFSAADADSALNLFSNLEPALIILDETVNGLTPTDLIQAIEARNLDSFIIVMSRQADLDHSMNWIMAGALACLSKPVQFEKLKPVIEMGLENKEAFREILQLTHDLKSANLELKKNQELLVKERGALNEKTKQIRFLYELSTDLSATLKTQAILDLVTRALAWLVKPDLTIIISAFVPQDQATFYTSRRLSPALTSRLADELMPQMERDLSSEDIIHHLAQPIKPARPLSRRPPHQIVLPLVVAGEKNGLLALYFLKKPKPDHDRRLLLESVVMQAAQALHNAHQHEAALHLATRDPLTGLFNRRAFEENLHQEYKRVRRHQRPMSLLMIDLDHFKSVNDRYGHQTGDEVLKTVAHIIANCARETDIPARFGGEEFAVILPDTPQDQALLLAERIQKKISQTAILVREVPLRLTISQGLAASDVSHVRQADDLVRLADRALYQAKEDGRNTIRTVEDLMIKTPLKGAVHA